MYARDAIQIGIPLDRDSWHGADSEGIWTRRVKALADKAIVEVDNIPFFTKSLSLGDKISVVFNHGRVRLDAIVERGGHSTYRVFVENENAKASKTLDMIKAMGCDWEKAEINGGELYAIDIPPEVDIYKVYEILERGQREGDWLFEEGYVGHPPKSDGSSRGL